MVALLSCLQLASLSVRHEGPLVHCHKHVCSAGLLSGAATLNGVLMEILERSG